jgi:hypothetical protein
MDEANSKAFSGVIPTAFPRAEPAVCGGPRRHRLCCGECYHVAHHRDNYHRDVERGGIGNHYPNSFSDDIWPGCTSTRGPRVVQARCHVRPLLPSLKLPIALARAERKLKLIFVSTLFAGSHYLPSFLSRALSVWASAFTPLLRKLHAIF